MSFDPELARADLALVGEFLADREEAIERFTKRLMFIPKILATQNARLGSPLNEHDLADLTQDTLIVIWRKLRTYEGRSVLEAWFYRICYLELMNSVRRKSRQPRLVEDLSDAVQPGTARTPSAGLEHEDILAGLETLEPSEADVIRLKLLDELTFDQVGEQLGFSPNTAKTRYYRGLTKLHAFLKNRFPETDRG